LSKEKIIAYNEQTIEGLNHKLEETLKENEILKEFNETLLNDNNYYKTKFTECTNSKMSVIRNSVLLALLEENKNHFNR
jgi:hypothetical protein